MKCPDCLAEDRLVAVPSLIPGFLFPLRLLLGSVYCDSCLHYYYRVRLFGWLGRGKAVSRDVDGRAIRMIGTHRDITERKRAEEALKRARDELEQKVGARTAELVTANDRLQQEITQRKKSEEALRQSHDELRTLYDGMVDGLAVFDTVSFATVQVNAALCKMLGYSEEEIKALTPEQKHPLDALPKIKAHYEAVRAGRASRYDAMPCITKAGKLLYLDVVSRHVSYIGRPCQLLFFHDVTELKQSQEALKRERQSLWKMLQASDHERQVISYEIHDGLAQYLAAAGMQFQAHDALRENFPDEAQKAHATAVELVRQAHSESRRLISEVRPPVIDEIGLETAISHLVHEQRRHGGPKIELHSSVQFGRLPSILENALYRIVQEALMNACRHSRSNKVRVRLGQEGQTVRLEVRDWGVGFEPDSVAAGHFGLEGIRERVRLLGGNLLIESGPGRGTAIRVEVPLPEREPSSEA